MKRKCFWFVLKRKLGPRQHSALSRAHLGQTPKQPSLQHPIVNRDTLKMHARSWLCIFNEVCLKYLIALCSFEKQIRLFSLIFDTEMNICKTHTLISLFWSIVSGSCRLRISTLKLPTGYTGAYHSLLLQSKTI